MEKRLERMLIERKWKKWVYFYLPMAVFIVFTLFPFYWMAVTAFRARQRALRAPGASRTPPRSGRCIRRWNTSSG